MKDEVEEYKLASSYEVHLGLGIRVYLRLEREMTDADKSLMYRVIDIIQDGIERETVRLDPKSSARAAAERSDLLATFPSQFIYVEEIPNGYCNSACCSQLPWYVVTTPRGRVKIGWRKRVINIDWSDSAVTAKADTLFPNEDVTKGDRYIHAYGYDKARMYLSKILA
jgi:hypothetical protein